MFSNVVPILNSYWVEKDQLLAGEHPCANLTSKCAQRLKWLFKKKVSCIIDLTKPNEFNHSFYLSKIQEVSHSENIYVEYKQFPIADMSIPTTDQIQLILDFINTCLDNNQTLYIHCYGGLGRTGTVIGCYLVRQGRNGIHALETINYLRKNTPFKNEPSPETEAQRQFVVEWEKIQYNFGGNQD